MQEGVVETESAGLYAARCLLRATLLSNISPAAKSNFSRVAPSPWRAPRPALHQSRLSAPSIPSITMAENNGDKIPLLLLKTRSTPSDGYEYYFSTFDGSRYKPIFVPVLQHQFKQDALDQVRRDITSRSFLASSGQDHAKYGAIIFTSQRAVEAFTQVVESIRNDPEFSIDELLPGSIPLYVVGPATARGLRALGLQCPILGEETGNGDALSTSILEHYNSLYQEASKPRILFLVGEKRRDVVPKTLQADELPPKKRLKVDELVIYETGEMLTFKSDFSSIWKKNTESGAAHQWVVVFSPTGCKAMLESLDILDEETGKLKYNATPRKTLIATIGPTTRDYLLNDFGFSPDVCAEKPSPEGVANGIKSYMHTAI